MEPILAYLLITKSSEEPENVRVKCSGKMSVVFSFVRFHQE
jgi:hypothetical protein